MMGALLALLFASHVAAFCAGAVLEKRARARVRGALTDQRGESQ